jgi:hypothetical protein
MPRDLRGDTRGHYPVATKSDKYDNRRIDLLLAR